MPNLDIERRILHEFCLMQHMPFQAVKVAFFLSFMTEKEALKWKQTFLRSITNDDGEMNFPTIKDFVGLLNSYFKPTNQTQDAAHQLSLLKQGKKTAEEIVTEFRLLISQAGYSSDEW